MLAIIGLFAGALLGVWLDDDFGAALGGIAGFFVGFWISKQRRQKKVAAVTQQTAPIARAAIVASESTSARIEALERRVAMLERQAADRHWQQPPTPWAGEATHATPPNDVADSITPMRAPDAPGAGDERTPLVSELIPRTARSDVQIAFPDNAGAAHIRTPSAAATSTATEPIDAGATDARRAETRSGSTTRPSAAGSAPPVNRPSL